MTFHQVRLIQVVEDLITHKTRVYPTCQWEHWRREKAFLAHLNWLKRRKIINHKFRAIMECEAFKTDGFEVPAVHYSAKTIVLMTPFIIILWIPSDKRVIAYLNTLQAIQSINNEWLNILVAFVSNCNPFQCTQPWRKEKWVILLSCIILNIQTFGLLTASSFDSGE